jgi:hypothetical protein
MLIFSDILDELFDYIQAIKQLLLIVALESIPNVFARMENASKARKKLSLDD